MIQGPERCRRHTHCTKGRSVRRSFWNHVRTWSRTRIPQSQLALRLERHPRHCPRGRRGRALRRGRRARCQCLRSTRHGHGKQRRLLPLPGLRRSSRQRPGRPWKCKGTQLSVSVRPRVPINGVLRRSCWRVLDLIISAQEARSAVDSEVERLLEAAIATSATSAAGDDHTPAGVMMLDRRLRRAISQDAPDMFSEITTIDEIAAKVGLSRGHFFALFRDQLDTTPQVFWSGVRVEEAMRRVAEGRRIDPSGTGPRLLCAWKLFSPSFKEHTGVSPSIFKRAAREPMPVDRDRDSAQSREMEAAPNSRRMLAPPRSDEPTSSRP